MRISHVSTAAVVLASALSGYADLAAPEPVSFASRGFSYVAEVFPPQSRRNPGQKPLCCLYHVGHPGTTWTVDAKLLWKAELVPLPEAGPYQAVLSVRGDLVVINGQTGRPEHSVIIYSPGGKPVKSYPLASLTSVTPREGGLPMWGWHRGARYFFLRREARFYILLPWGKAMEFNLDDGTLQHGDTTDFPKLAAVARKPHADEEAKIWATSLRFSSITDVLQAGVAVPHAAPTGAELAPEEEVTLHALLKGSELIVVGTLRRTDDSRADKMWAGHIDVAKVLLGDPTVRDLHVHFQDPADREGSARRQAGQSGIWFIFKDGDYRKVIWPHQLKPAEFAPALGPYLKGFIAAEVRRLSRSDAKAAAARLQHLRANLRALASVGERRLKPEAALKAAAAAVRARHPASGKAMWEALAALIKPGMTVAEMKAVLPDRQGQVLTATGGGFGIRYKLDDRDDGFDAVAFGAWAGAKPGDPDSKLVLSVAPRIERTSLKAIPLGSVKVAQPADAALATRPASTEPTPLSPLTESRRLAVDVEVAAAFAKAVAEHARGFEDLKPGPDGGSDIDWSLVCHDDTKTGGKALNRSAAMDALVAKIAGPAARGAGARIDKYVEAAGNFLSHKEAPYRAVACELLYRFPRLMVELGLVPKVGALLDDHAVAFAGADVSLRSIGSPIVKPGVKLTVAEIAQRALSAATSCILPDAKVFQIWWQRNRDYRHRLWYWALRWRTAKPENDLGGLADLEPREALRILLLVANNPAGRRESLLGFPSPAELRKLPFPKAERPEPCYHLQTGPQPTTVADFVRKHSLKPVLMEVLRQKIPWPEVAGNEEMGTLLHQAVPVMALVFDESDAAKAQRTATNLPDSLKQFGGLAEELRALAAVLSRAPATAPATGPAKAELPQGPAEWQSVATGKLAAVSVERALYEKAGTTHFFVRVRITNLTDRSIGVDLRSKDSVIYPNQWGMLPTNARGEINERRIKPRTVDEALRARMLAAFRGKELTAVTPRGQTEYFREFNASGRKDIDKQQDGWKYLFVSTDGQLFVTDGQSVENVNCSWGDGGPEKTDLILRLPIAWKKV
ncbi:MAG: hypothetical protein AMS14_06710, partial [Planctomycetes bacterium DG_20]